MGKRRLVGQTVHDSDGDNSIMAMNTRAQAPRVPDRAAPEGLEAKWGEAWESQGTYAFDRTATREQVYSIDTPRRRYPAPCTSAMFSPTRTLTSWPATSA